MNTTPCRARGRAWRGLGWALALAGLWLLGAGCSSARIPEDPAAYETEVLRLQARLVDNPQDAEALRDLGVIYMRTRRYSQAHDHLEKAYARDANDPKTLFYLGLASETIGQVDTALRLYEKYPAVSRRSPYRKLLLGRYEWVNRKRAHEEIRRLLAEEAQLGSGATSPRIVAVFPFVYQGTNARFAPIGRGLGEMLTVDLAHVRSLTVVERVRLQALLGELALAQTAYVEAATAPRTGRLLQAGRLVGGTYNVLDEALSVEATVVASQEPDAPGTQSAEGTLRRFFELEKQLVFRILDEMDVTVTPEERARIETIPTENLLAFLAYSRGLEREEANAYPEAARFYQEAVRFDPNFSLAADRAEAAEALADVVDSPEEMVAETSLLDELMRGGPDLVSLRLGLLNASLGAGVVPGQDKRQPAVDAVSTGTHLGDLPGPPPPPSGNTPRP